MKLKILVVSESIDVNDSSASKGRVALIRNLDSIGCELKVLHYTRKEINIDNIECEAIKENRRSFLFFLSRSERYLRYKTGIKLYSFIDKLFGFSFTLYNDRNCIKEAIKIEESTNYDWILTLSKGGSFRPHHALLGIPEWHSKWLAYVHDPYPMHSYPRPYDWVEPGHHSKRNFFLKVAANCRYAIYPSRLLGEWMESYYPPLKGKRIIIPHQIDSCKYEEELPDFFNPSKFNLVHAGTLMSARNPRILIEAFQNFIKLNPDAAGDCKLIFIGAKSTYSELLKNTADEVPQLFASEDYLDYSLVRNIQNKASVNIILEAKGPISPFLPGKFPHCYAGEGEIMLLGPYYSESRRLLGEIAFWAEIDDKNEIMTIIEALYKNWKNKKNVKKDPNLQHYLSPLYLKESLLSLN